MDQAWPRPRPRLSKVHMMQNQHACCLPLCFASALQPANFLQEMCPFSFPRPWGFQYAFLGKASTSPYALGPATKCRPKLEHSASRRSRVRQHSPHGLHAPTVGGPSRTCSNVLKGTCLEAEICALQNQILRSPKYLRHRYPSLVTRIAPRAECNRGRQYPLRRGQQAKRKKGESVTLHISGPRILRWGPAPLASTRSERKSFLHRR